MPRAQWGFPWLLQGRDFKDQLESADLHQRSQDQGRPLECDGLFQRTRQHHENNRDKDTLLVSGLSSLSPSPHF